MQINYRLLRAHMQLITGPLRNAQCIVNLDNHAWIIGSLYDQQSLCTEKMTLRNA
jgi:hypothetical protein